MIFSLFFRKAQVSLHRGTTHRSGEQTCDKSRGNGSRPDLGCSRCVNESKRKHREFRGVDVNVSFDRCPCADCPHLGAAGRSSCRGLCCGLCRALLLSLGLSLGSISLPTNVSCIVSFTERGTRALPLRNNAQTVSPFLPSFVHSFVRCRVRTSNIFLHFP